MRRFAGLASLVCLVVCTYLTWAQEPPKAQPQKPNLSGTQEDIARTYKALEGTLLKIANKLERTGTKEGVEKARVILKALQEAREKDIAINLTQLADTLKDVFFFKQKTAY